MTEGQATTITVVSFLVGVAGHQSRRFTETFSTGWQENAEHAIGMSLVFFPMVAWFMALEDEPPLKRFVLAFWAGALTVGAGVITGWFLEGLEHK